MKTICSWCGKTIVEGHESPGESSHGCCPDCKADLIKLATTPGQRYADHLRDEELDRKAVMSGFVAFAVLASVICGLWYFSHCFYEALQMCRDAWR